MLSSIPLNKDLPKDTNPDALWEIYDVKDKPTRFLVVLRHCSEYPESENFIEEWESPLPDESNYDGIFQQCICSQEIHQVWHVTNKHNRITLPTGSCCMLKFMQHLEGEVKFQEKHLKYKKKLVENGATTGLRRQCLSCGNHRIDADAEEWKTQCKTCFKEKRPIQFKDPEKLYRPCSICHELNIPTDSPEWMSKCRDCFKQSKETYVEKRSCDRCGKLAIPTSEPSWKRNCIACFLATKK